MNWLPFVYQYSIQTIVFAIGMVLAFRSGQLSLKHPKGRLYLFWMILTFVVYFSLQGTMQFILPRI